MNTSSWVYRGYFLLEDFCSVDRTTCRWDACDEDLCAVFLEDFLDSAPMGDFKGSDCGADGDRVETE